MIHKLKNFIKEKYIWILLITFLTIFLIISCLVIKKNIFELDLKIYDFLVSNRNNTLNIFFITITKLGNALTLIVLAILSIIFFKNKKYKLLVPLNLATIALLNFIFKHIFLRQRPNELRLIEESGYSFPSGHAMSGTAFYGLLIYFFYLNIKNKKLRNAICLLIGLLILLINISRVYVGVHYFSDVIAGSCFSIAYLILITRIANKYFNNDERG